MALKNKRPIGLDTLLDNTDESNKRIAMYDKQMHQITPSPIHIKSYKVRLQNDLKCYKAKDAPYMLESQNLIF